MVWRKSGCKGTAFSSFCQIFLKEIAGFMFFFVNLHLRIANDA
jgi:hypothetical protein